jgi:hypothetical protein
MEKRERSEMVNSNRVQISDLEGRCDDRETNSWNRHRKWTGQGTESSDFAIYAREPDSRDDLITLHPNRCSNSLDHISRSFPA